MDKFQTFEQCCEALGLNPEACLPEVSNVPAKHQESITALAKLMSMIQRVPRESFPFIATIVRENECYQFQ